MKTFSDETLSKAIFLGLIELPIDKNDINILSFLSVIILFYFQKILVLVFSKKIILKKLYIYISIIFEIRKAELIGMIS